MSKKPRLSLLAMTLLVVLAVPAAAQSRKGELRGVWMGSGYGRDWPALMRSLHDNGFNAIFPNLCAGGAAGSKGGDELRAAARAGKEYGVEVHVWCINWVLENAPADVLKQYEAEGRLMRDSEGKPVRDDPDDGPKLDWLCPSHPANRKLEKNAMLELARRYDIAGIQFDYLRFPSAAYCFCDHCKAQFQQDTGLAVESWPADVVSGGRYGDRYRRWQQGLQTSLVKEISEEAHRIKPGIAVSLAARPGLGSARHSVLQDWPEWVKQGWLDFVCLMNDGADSEQVAGRLQADVTLVQGAIPVYAVLGPFPLNHASELIEQVKAAREAGADGFVVSDDSTGDLTQWLPALRARVTASDPNPMPHWGPPSVLRVTGPALLTPAADRRVQAGETLKLDLKLGSPPPSSDPAAEEGASQAASVLRQAMGVPSPAGGPAADDMGSGMLDSTYHLTGRVVVETPSGDTLAIVSAFSADWQYLRQLTVTTPAGPFRLALYGTEQVGESARDFVARSVLLTGVEAAPVSLAPASDTHGRITSLIADFLKSVPPERLAGLTAVVQLRVDGDDGGDWWVRAEGGKGVSGEGSAVRPDLTLTVSTEDFLALARGEADPYTLWRAGRLTASGDMALLTQLLPLLVNRGGV